MRKKVSLKDWQNEEEPNFSFLVLEGVSVYAVRGFSEAVHRSPVRRSYITHSSTGQPRPTGGQQFFFYTMTANC